MRASGAGNAQDAGFAICQQKSTPRAGHTRQSRAERVGKSALKAWPMLASARCLCSASGAASPGGTLPTVEKPPAPAKPAGTSGKQWRWRMSVLTFPQKTHAPFTSAAGPHPHPLPKQEGEKPPALPVGAATRQTQKNRPKAVVCWVESQKTGSALLAKFAQRGNLCGHHCQF